MGGGGGGGWRGGVAIAVLVEVSSTSTISSGVPVALALAPALAPALVQVVVVAAVVVAPSVEALLTTLSPALPAILCDGDHPPPVHDVLAACVRASVMRAHPCVACCALERVGVCVLFVMLKISSRTGRGVSEMGRAWYEGVCVCVSPLWNVRSKVCGSCLTPLPLPQCRYA